MDHRLELSLRPCFDSVFHYQIGWLNILSVEVHWCLMSFIFCFYLRLIYLVLVMMLGLWLIMTGRLYFSMSPADQQFLTTKSVHIYIFSITILLEGNFLLLLSFGGFLWLFVFQESLAWQLFLFSLKINKKAWLLSSKPRGCETSFHLFITMLMPTPVLTWYTGRIE